MSTEMSYTDAQMQLLGMVAGSVAATTALTKVLVQAGVVDPDALCKMLDQAAEELAFAKDTAADKGMRSFLGGVKNAAKAGANP